METQIHFYKRAQEFFKSSLFNKSTVFILDKGFLNQRSDNYKWLPSIKEISLCIEVTGSDECKSLGQLENILSKLAYSKIPPTDISIIGIGGGAVCDLAGFVGSVFARGVPTSYVPTTLLAAVDASIGGKTALNVSNIKNLVGSVYHPKQVFIIEEFIKNSPHQLIRDGFAEIFKHGLIQDKSLFDSLTSIKPSQDIDGQFNLLDLIKLNQKIKLDVVNQSIKNPSLRNILNFGHTVAHGLEQYNPDEFTHGQAVFIGMCYESLLSAHLGFLEKVVAHQIIETLIPWISGFEQLSAVDFHELYEMMMSDKKSKGSQPRFVALSDIGKVQNSDDYCQPVPLDLFEIVDNEIKHVLCHTRTS